MEFASFGLVFDACGEKKKCDVKIRQQTNFIAKKSN
jgi:hypothetical protein